MKTKFISSKPFKVTINQKRLVADFMKGSRPSFTTLATNEIMPIVERAQREMVEEFVQHPVTQEINAGPTAGNISGTLGGVGNLFAFLGFEKNSNPTLNILDILNKSPRVSKVITAPSGRKHSFGVGGWGKLD